MRERNVTEWFGRECEDAGCCEAEDRRQVAWLADVLPEARPEAEEREDAVVAFLPRFEDLLPARR